MTPIKCKWFEGRVGIVLAQDEDGNEHYFIGAGNGLNEVIDINLIIARGSPFPRDAGDVLYARVPTVAKRPSGTKGVSTVAEKRRRTSSKTTRSTKSVKTGAKK